mmetsp:Transcript_5477/g.11306  ORF Transcript_5477/g.11306 Transcript_5477/m.11306 type:complete len:181 (+) Transcript_5477:278-820(+)
MAVRAAVVRVAAVAIATVVRAQMRTRRNSRLDSKSLRLLCQSWQPWLSSGSCLDDPARRNPAPRAKVPDRPVRVAALCLAPDPRVAVVLWDAADHVPDVADHEPAAVASPAATTSSWKKPRLEGADPPEEAEVDPADRDPRDVRSPEPDGKPRPRFWCKKNLQIERFPDRFSLLTTYRCL